MMINFLKNPWFYIPAVALVVLVLAVSGVFSGEDSPYDFITVEARDLNQEVSVTGTVEPSQSVNLSFETGGRATAVNVSVGDRVFAGQILASLNTSELRAQLQEAKASLESASATLAQLKRGPTQEEIAVQQSSLEDAKQTLSNHYNSVLDELEEAYADSNDSVRVKTSSVFSGSKNSSYQMDVTSCDVNSEGKATDLRLNSEVRLDNWRNSLDELNSEEASRTQLGKALDNAKDHLRTFREMLTYTNAVLTAGCIADDSQYDDERSNISTAISNINSAMSEITTLEGDIASQKTKVVKAQNDLDELLSGTSQEEIDAQRAKVAQAEAQVQSVEAKIANKQIYAPFSGTVTRVDLETGEVISAGNTVVSVISSGRFEIKANIPEVDIAKVEVGDKADVTLDAYGDGRVFTANVSEIDPAETIVEGVSTYGTTLQFASSSDLIKSGMTANIDIQTGLREGVFAVPKRAVISQGGRQYVRVLREDNTIREVDVETGLLASDGYIEITQGLNGGERVVTFIEE